MPAPQKRELMGLTCFNQQRAGVKIQDRVHTEHRPRETSRNGNHTDTSTHAERADGQTQHSSGAVSDPDADAKQASTLKLGSGDVLEDVQSQGTAGRFAPETHTQTQHHDNRHSFQTSPTTTAQRVLCRGAHRPPSCPTEHTPEVVPTGISAPAKVTFQQGFRPKHRGLPLSTHGDAEEGLSGRSRAYGGKSEHADHTSAIRV